MTLLSKVFKWAYGDSLRYVAFIVAFTAFVAFLMTLIAYPVQTIATVVIAGAFIMLLTFFHEYNK